MVQLEKKKILQSEHAGIPKIPQNKKKINSQLITSSYRLLQLEYVFCISLQWLKKQPIKKLLSRNCPVNPNCSLLQEETSCLLTYGGIAELELMWSPLGSRKIVMGNSAEKNKASFLLDA